MSEYNCIQCNYQTKDRSNYAKHVKSNKHQQKLTVAKNKFGDPHSTLTGTSDIFQCQYCQINYSRKSALTKHQKICMGKQMEIQKLENEKQLELEKLKLRLEMTEKQLDDEKKKNNVLEDLIKTSKPSQTNQMFNISIKKLVQSEYINAPPLAQLENYEVIHDNPFVEFVDEIIKYNDQKTLYKYIGNIIIKHYKKEKPEDQSMWNTDISRLNYIIKEAMVSNNSRWVDDINANRIKETVIRPLLEYIKSQNIKEQKLIHKEIKKASIDKCIELTQKINSIATINYEIANGTLETDIIKYISPYFRHLSDKQQIILKSE